MSGALIALAVSLVFLGLSGDLGLFEVIVLSAAGTCFLALLMAMLRTNRVDGRLEVLTFLILGIYFVVELSGVFYFSGEAPAGIIEALSRFAVWFPTLYASMLLVLGVERGWRFVLGHFGLIALLGVPFLYWNRGPETLPVVFALVQIYLSCGIVIAIVVTFVRYNELLILHRAELERQANTDFVTEIGNRRQMERLLAQEVRSAERYGETLSLVLLDLDRFKRVNDLHGHPVGDRVLRETSALLRSQLRSDDHLGRWGGEEFVVIMPRTGLAAARRVAERIIDAVRDNPYLGVGTLTMSGGVAELRHGEGQRELVRRADLALYAAKQEGRNRVEACVEGQALVEVV